MTPEFELTKKYILFHTIFSINIRPSIQTNVSHYQLLDATKYICLTEGTGDSLTQSTYLAKNK